MPDQEKGQITGADIPDLDGDVEADIPELEGSGRYTLQDPTIADQFIATNGTRLYSFAVTRCRSLPEDPEDLVQEALTRMLQRGYRCEELKHLFSIGCAVLNNKAIDLSRKYRREVDAPELDGESDQTSFLDVMAVKLGLVDTADHVEIRKAVKAMFLGFDYLPVYVRPSYATAGRNLKILWLLIVEDIQPNRVTYVVESSTIDNQMKARARRLLQGWMYALCGFSPLDKSDNAVYQRYWRAGYEAGQAFLKDHPDWWRDSLTSTAG